MSKRTATGGAGGSGLPASSARVWSKIHGWPNEPRAIITPAHSGLAMHAKRIVRAS